MSREFMKFISGDDTVSYETVLLEINGMVYKSARKIGRLVDKNDVDEISSCFFEFLWENKQSGKFPLTDEVCFSKLKRIIYSKCSLTKEIGGYDETFSSDSALVLVTKIKETISKEPFLFGIDNTYLHDDFKKVYFSIVENTEVDSLYELAESRTFLGNVLLSFLMRRSGNFFSKTKEEPEVRGIFDLTKDEEYIFLACFLIKLPKNWIIPAYINWGANLFSASLSFLGHILTPGLEKYFRNLFFSVKIYCHIEKMLAGHDIDTALRETSRKYDIRLRDIVRRYEKIKRILLKYDTVVENYILQMRNDLSDYLNGYRGQMKFEFLESESDADDLT